MARRMRRRSQYTYSTIEVQARKRSVFDLSHGHTTTANMGELFPILCEEVYPHDTFKVKETFVSRTFSPLIRPCVGNFFIDRFYFFVPDRVLFDKWPELFGYNPNGPWVNEDAVTVPLVEVPVMSDTTSTGYSGGLGDHLKYIVPGMTYSSTKSLNALPFYAIGKIWNDWFVSEATGTPVALTPQDSVVLNTEVWAPDNIFGKCPSVYKVHDRFTSALPDVQKGSPVTVSLGDQAPVMTNNGAIVTGVQAPMTLSLSGSGGPVAATSLLGVNGFTGDFGTVTAGTGTVTAGNFLYPNNLYADLSQVTGVSVNDLRYAFATQRILERAARAGTRLQEYIYSTFGVMPTDARLDRAEYLGGRRSPLMVQQVAQTFGVNETGSEQQFEPLGTLGAFSNSSGRSGCMKSFTEHGWLICLACIRQYHTYQQGIPRAYRRKTRFDYYDPAFAHIGEQPIYQDELFASAPEDSVFGYTEAWNELRQHPNEITGAVLSTMSNGLDVWHMGDNYANAPVLNDSFLQEGPENMDRVLQVGSSQAPQFLLDFWFDESAVRCMPVKSTPGLLDH